MLYGAYISAAGALANSYRQDVVANNLANAETVAFKRDLALLQTRATESAQRGQSRHTASLLEGIGGGVFALPTHTSFTPAALDKTDNPYDLALAGNGFFEVQKGEETLYTRDGRFLVNSDGQLVTVTEQLPVLNAQGQPITLDLTQDFSVNEAGVISQNGEEVTRLGVVDFNDYSQLSKQGENLYTAEGGGATAIEAQVKQGHLENSGVNAVSEMVNLIRMQRMFQTNVEMLQIQDQTLGSALSQMGKLSGA